jgi:LEA14-like dessication related protein
MRSGISAVLVALFVLAGCASIHDALVSAPKPGAKITGAALADLTLEGATVNFEVEVSNPYGFDLPLSNLEYALGSDGATFLIGKADIAGLVPAKGRKTVKLPARVGFAELLKTASKAKLGSVIPYNAEMTLTMDVPGTGPLSLPLQKRGELPIPAPPEVELTSLRWEKFSFEEATAVLDLRILNKNQFAMDLTRIGLSLALADTPIVQSSVAQKTAFDPGAAKQLVIPISIQPKNLGLAAFRMLSGESAGYSINGIVNVNSTFGPMQLPYSRQGTTALLRK